MKKLLLTFFLLVSVIVFYGADDDFFLAGRVKESFAKTDLIHAKVFLMDAEGNASDSVTSNMGVVWKAGAVDTMSYFYIKVPRVDSTYVFEVTCEGYKPLTMTQTVDKIGKRERARDMGVIYMERAPVMLKEVTVTSSKIKFYNDGDTLVYNADAFNLAEGSMLDALIAQLPGVELNTDGQIKVNGEFVESLLLDGKQFFDGNNNLMLENIAAYTVKDIKVYEAPTKQNVLMGNEATKVLTMNIQLKKEYNIGWLVNTQAGYGTSDRYLGKAFLSWFNPTTRISAVANVNNLNSNRTPGRDDTWTPDEMPDGTKQYATGAINYNYEHPESKVYAEGTANFTQSIDNVQQTTDRINFLPDGDNYENSYSNSHSRVSSFRTAHMLNFELNKSMSLGVNTSYSYTYGKMNSSNLSGAFSHDPGEMSREILDAIYSSGSEELLGSLLNRSRNQSDTWNRSNNFYLYPYLRFNLPKSNDVIVVVGHVGYNNEKSELWRDYEINYGGLNPLTQKLRQFTNGQPNHQTDLGGSVQYSSAGAHYFALLKYDYEFSEKTRDSYLYALDRLNDSGIYGTLPVDYLLALDPKNSYSSNTVINNHSLMPILTYYTTLGESNLTLTLQPTLSLEHRKFAYNTNNTDYRLSKSFATINIQGYTGAMLQYDFNGTGEGRQKKFRNSLRYSYSVTPTLPDLFDMVDVVNDSDPLNIYMGNPDLKTAWRHRHLFRWQYTPLSHPTFMNILYFSYTHASNSLTRGYTYDTSTGVRYNKMYNVNGNRTWAVTNELKWQFGSTKQFTLSSNTDGILATYNDMIGVNMSQPQRVTVHNNTLTENLKLGWQIGSQNIGLRCDVTTRHTTSQQPGFNTLNATHLNYGINGTFILPAGFSMSTDFMCYTRRGYGSDYLDTTDPVWNLRVSYAPVNNKHWIFMLDGFDILQQLSNVNYAVTASGRTVSYVNTIPRYVMLSVQYRLNIQPKKR
ncbi:MAG: outer membrane beta-barrel protein [Muribaculaceae bacterium]|nr:outer membrane beta-barrel protein [Muribaculaceae bacterium]